jgi:hypothetical protein
VEDETHYIYIYIYDIYYIYDRKMKPSKTLIKVGGQERVSEHDRGTVSKSIAHIYGIITMKPPCILNVY